MGQTQSRKKPLDAAKLKLNSTCYQTTYSSDVGSDYLGKLTKKSKNTDGTYSVAFETGMEWPSASEPMFLSTRCRKESPVKVAKKSKKLIRLRKELSECVQQKCKKEIADSKKADAKIKKEATRCKGLSTKGRSSDYYKCNRTIWNKFGKASWEGHRCTRKKCRDQYKAEWDETMGKY
jgi:hypothetical protein